MIRDLAIEQGWDQGKFDGFDKPLLDHVSGFHASSNDAFVRQHWTVSWNELFPVKPASSFVCLGAESGLEKREMRSLIVRVCESSASLGLCASDFKGYDATVA